MKKKKFHWGGVPLVLGAIVLLAVTGLVLYLHSVLPWQNMVALTSNFQMKLSDGMRKFALSGNRDYSTLPDLLVMSDGTAVQTVQQMEQRREEILALFEENVYGTLPKEGFSTGFEILETGDALNGAATRKQVKITVTTEKGSAEALLLLYVPKQALPAPVVIGLNFNGNHTVLADDAILLSYALDPDEENRSEERGAKSYRWNIEDCIARGYAVATVYSGDFAPDSSDEYASRFVSLFDEPEFKAVGAWSFGMLRAVDYVMQDGDIDSTHIALIGHSRLGKAAVWAGANDARVGLVISNDSGNTGASLSRGNHGETVKSINLMFPHWFSSAYKSYGGNPNLLPVDQNLLIAAIAPRQVYIASAEGDLWADPTGAFNCLQYAKSAFALYGKEVIGEEEPATDTAFFCESMGYHVRSGWHDILPKDWSFYLDYMELYFK